MPHLVTVREEAPEHQRAIDPRGEHVRAVPSRVGADLGCFHQIGPLIARIRAFFSKQIHSPDSADATLTDSARDSEHFEG